MFSSTVTTYGSRLVSLFCVRKKGPPLDKQKQQQPITVWPAYLSGGQTNQLYQERRLKQVKGPTNQYISEQTTYRRHISMRSIVQASKSSLQAKGQSEARNTIDFVLHSCF